MSHDVCKSHLMHHVRPVADTNCILEVIKTPARGSLRSGAKYLKPKSCSPPWTGHNHSVKLERCIIQVLTLRLAPIPSRLHNLVAAAKTCPRVSPPLAPLIPLAKFTHGPPGSSRCVGHIGSCIHWRYIHFHASFFSLGLIHFLKAPTVSLALLRYRRIFIFIFTRTTVLYTSYW